MDKNMRSYVAELVGTFAVVFLAAGAVCANHLFAAPLKLESATVLVDQPRPGLLGVAVASGLAYAVALAVTLPLAGGYLNPAITLMLWVFKRFDGTKTAGLIFVQLLGAALAGGLIRLIFGSNLETLTLASMGTPHLNLGNWGLINVTLMSVFSGALAEMCMTFILTFVIFATIIDPRTPKIIGPVGTWLAPLWVGLVMIGIVLAGFGLTGAATNPARWFGTVIWEFSVPALQTAGPFRDHMVYWIGPIVGTLLAGGVYTALILPPEEDEFKESVASTSAKAGVGSTLFRAKK